MRQRDAEVLAHTDAYTPPCKASGTGIFNTYALNTNIHAGLAEHIDETAF